MDRQEQAGRQDAQLTDRAVATPEAGAAADIARWRLAAGAAVLALTALRLLYLAISPLELDFEEAQYWFWAQAPDWGYFSKPPLIAWLIALSTAVLGDGEFGVRAWSPILHGGAALCLGEVGARLGGPRTGFWTALAYASLPGVAFSSLLMTTDVPLAFAWSLALLAFLRLGERDGTRWAAVGGIAAGMGLLAKYAMLFFLPAAVLALLLLPEWRRRIPSARLALFAGLATLLILPNLLWNLGQGGVTVVHTLELAGAGGRAARPEDILAFFEGQGGIAGALILPMLLAIGFGLAAIRRWERTEDRPLLLLACFVLPFFAVYLPLAFATRANANWTALAYVAATAAAVFFLIERGAAGILRVLVLLHLAIAVVAPAVVIAAPALNLGIGERLIDRMSGWRELGKALAEKRAERPEARVLFFDPTLAKRMIYYARIERGGFAMWDSDPAVGNELERVASLRSSVGGSWLIVTEGAVSAEMLRLLFIRVGPAAETVVTLPSGRVRSLIIQEADGFIGYPP